ncbi:PBP1A family penicillin-binding protein [Ponticoccus sp. SC2-23]|uniref:penicillin-binding protein 1A n=1 Tax=Alexandriicola marinus TaxID=2081710 RepID=UPI000FD84E90|nr:PBP1A family penicillin-binding protein [Alexandriicola marinus]MBM1219308.1 PBP1A family penicillin-binding protein [Ponticoccus sp. SC6-9]MBM1223620.1 PBP1A family penicillin-binding protein [Ponticoccus sp. SC6-15]MBM1229121.1 PBP1A family penicillin-binding protein [Ponticoccus sp. SC6-38]MBM1232586.1 PBP1A family penicillin-binding protein [Ponticoccus sp. SC6-45]MBM1237464.1 PBP1A family penicillin-binding protein [Ponticoccus sp. SC6-49]MBM1241597.1 PBP1A family penicillin-binding p
MVRFVFSFFGGLFSMVTLGIGMGALTLGAVFYMYGRDLPSYEVLAQYAPKTISRIYSVEGRVIDEFASERRLFTPAEEIPDLVKQAFISAEDRNFYLHPGYDIRGIAAAFVEAVQSRGQDLRGASTITQQVMKNFLLSADRTAERKIKEIILATRIEQAMDKERILELYLNEIFLGQNSYGVAAAAQTYYNKPLSRLTPGEAAYLAALAQRPGNLHPVRQEEAAINRRNYVLREMYENGYLDLATMRAQQDAPLLTVQAGDVESFRASLPPRDYFTDEIRRQLSRDFGEEEFFGGGLSVRATIDPDLQVEAAHALQQALEQFDRGSGRWRGTGETLPLEALSSEEAWRAALSEVSVARDVTLESQWYPAVVLEVADQSLRLGIEGWQDGDPEPVVPRRDIEWMRGDFFDNFEVGDVVHVRRMVADGDGAFIRWTLRQIPEVQGAFMAMDVNTGRVLAMQGGFSYQHSVFNRATQAFRQPGSAFKPFVFAAALDSGYTPATIVVDAPIEINTPQGVWRPQNASNRYYGPTPLRTGIEQSRNLMTIRLAQEVGMDVVAEYAERFGVYEDMGQVLAGSLGAEETTLFRMVAAYSMFANGGERVEPTLVDRVQDRFGNTVYRHNQSICPDCGEASLPRGQAPRIQTNRDRIMNAVTAYQLTSMMQGVVQRGTARGINLPVPIAGKTGTTNDAKDVWFVGFSSNIAAGCYIGYDTPRSMGGASGGGVCGPVFEQFMRAAIAQYGGTSFSVPEDCRFINIDRFSGARLPDDASGDNVVSECFRDGEEPVFGITFDGGFAMSGDLPLFDEVRQQVQTAPSASGGTAQIGPRATFGTLSSGGLY